MRIDGICGGRGALGGGRLGRGVEGHGRWSCVRRGMSCCCCARRSFWSSRYWSVSRADAFQETGFQGSGEPGVLCSSHVVESGFMDK